MTQKARWEWYSGSAVPVLQRQDLSEVLRQDDIARRVNALETMVECQDVLVRWYKVGGRVPSETILAKMDAAAKVVYETVPGWVERTEVTG